MVTRCWLERTRRGEPVWRVRYCLCVRAERHELDVAASAECLRARILPIDFGHSVALQGDTAVVGAPGFPSPLCRRRGFCFPSVWIDLDF